MQAKTAYIGFGANLGDPIQQILDARRKLAAHRFISNFSNSALYLSSPVGDEAQPEFVNSVSSVETTLPPHELLSVMQEIEMLLGRERDPDNKNGPRRIDLDLLLYGAESISDSVLTVPHPRLANRLFTLRPLCELNPALNLGGAQSVSEILAQGHESGRFDGQTIYRLT